MSEPLSPAEVALRAHLRERFGPRLRPARMEVELAEARPTWMAALEWAGMQDLAEVPANVLARHGIERAGMTPTEQRILAALLGWMETRPGRVMPYRLLVARAWPEGEGLAWDLGRSLLRTNLTRLRAHTDPQGVCIGAVIGQGLVLHRQAEPPRCPEHGRTRTLHRASARARWGGSTAADASLREAGC